VPFTDVIHRLQRLFYIKREEVAGDWRTLHNGELHNLYDQLNIIWVIKSRRIKWDGDVAHMGAMGNAYRILARGPERKRPLRRH
jgi:hypothetical protein